jgi:hypothetical protein
MVRNDDHTHKRPGALPSQASDGGHAHRPSSSPLSQLEQFVRFVEHLIDHPPGPYRPTAMAKEIGYTESRIRRWLLLLTDRRWLRRIGKDFYQAERFDQWGRSYVHAIIGRGDQ